MDFNSSFSIKPFYEKRPPSSQTVLDLFKDTWKTRLPGLIAGDTALLDICKSRVDWADKHLPGGLDGKSVLELGPFEAYMTMMLTERGAAHVVSVEGNSVNFLKCLALKEILNLRCDLLFGDVRAFLKDHEARYDLVFASGILYHMQHPVEVLTRMCQCADSLYIWTHYFDAEVIADLDPVQKVNFIPDHDKIETYDGKELRLHARSYQIEQYETNIPGYWEGGPEDLTYWMEKADILHVLNDMGFDAVFVETDNTEISGLPAISLFATRSNGRMAPGRTAGHLGRWARTISSAAGRLFGN